MSEAAVWLILLVLAGLGLAVSRFNPVVRYPRTTLYRLAILAILGAGVLLWAGFFGAPPQPPSGVANLYGG